MPVIEMTVLEKTVNEDKWEALIQVVTKAVFQWSGLPDTPRAWASLRTYLYEAKPGTFAVGGRLQTTNDPVFYRVIVTMPQNWLSPAQKQGLVEEVTRSILLIEGAPYNDLNRFRIQCLIPEIPDGSWGSGGQALSLSDLANIFGVELASSH